MLKGGTAFDLRHRPVGYSSFVLAEHAFARTRHIGDDEVEGVAQRFEVLWCIASHCGIRKAPFGDVLCKDACATAINLVAYYLTACGHGADGSRALAARRGAKVETSHWLLYQMTDDMGDEHA